MSWVDPVRIPLPRLRVILAALMLAFALGSIAHVAHQHEAATTSATHSLACGYCLSFGGLADAPRHTYAPTIEGHVTLHIEAAVNVWFRECLTTSARPRAPPLA
jgi:hypothetical protein